MGARPRKSRSEEIDLGAADRGPRARRKSRKGNGHGGGRSRRDRIVRWVKIVGVVCGGLALAGAVTLGGLLLHYGSDSKLPTITKLSDYRPPQMTRVLDRHGELVDTLGPQKRTFVPFATIPKILVQAVVAAEDPNYFEHGGIDYRGIFRAFVANTLGMRWGRSAQGGSTITQQVVKEMLLTREKTLRRKFQEWILARRLSKSLSKEEILEIYLNQINYGHGRYGCEEGARFYFAKPVAKVDLSEAAFLAGVPQIPGRLSPHKNPEGAQRRRNYVLGQMAKHGYVPHKTAEALAREPLVIVREPLERPSEAPEALGSVARFLAERYGKEAIATLGTTVKTTIDLKLQRAAREAIERGLEELDARQGYRGPLRHLEGKALARHRVELAKARGGTLKPSVIVEGIVAKVDRDPGDKRGGKLHVDVGGLIGVVDLSAETRYAAGAKPLAERFRAGDVVRVRAAPERRRIGGADDKTLLLALELGPQAAMVVIDPQSRDLLALVGGYGYRAGGFDRAQRALRQAGSAFKPFVYGAAIDSGRFTAASIVNDSPEVYDLWKPENYDRNFRGPVSLRVALADSINTVAIKLLNDIGIPAVKDFASRSGITTELPDDVGLAMALGAASVTPLELANAYATLATLGRREEPQLVRAVGEEVIERPAPQQVLRPETAYITTSLMRSVVEVGSGRAAGQRLRRPLAGKTGTSNKARDAWFVGFAPDLLAAVWVGFDDGLSLGSSEAGGKTAVPIWTAFMGKALAGRPIKDFQQPPGITFVRIDPKSGLLASPGGEGVEEVFTSGSEPKETAPVAGEPNSADQLLLEATP